MVTAPKKPSWFVRRAAKILHTSTDSIITWERLILTAFFVTLAVFGARSAHLLDVGELWWLDRMANADRPQFNAPIVVVGITDEDFYNPELFGGISPLDPDALKHIVERVLEHEPKGVILDVLIHPAPGESPDRVAARSRLFQSLADAEADPPVILARNPVVEDRERRSGDPGWSDFDELTNRQNLVWASSAIRGSGGYIRAVPERYEGEEGHASELPTILGAATTALELESHRSKPWWIHHEESDPTLPWRIRFSGHFLNLESSMTPHNTDAGSVLSLPAVEGAHSLLKDKIVLIGVTSYAGRDVLATVVGDMAGVYVWAEAIASWIRHDALREPLEIFAFILEFLIGVVTGLLLVRFRPALGLLFAILIISPLMIGFSLLTFGDRVLFVNFLPSFVAVYLHYQIEIHLELRKLEKKVKNLTEEEATA